MTLISRAQALNALVIAVRCPGLACLFEALTLGERGGIGEGTEGEPDAELMGEIVMDVEGLLMSMGKVEGPELEVTLGAGGDRRAGGGRKGEPFVNDVFVAVALLIEVMFEPPVVVLLAGAVELPALVPLTLELVLKEGGDGGRASVVAL